MIGQCTDKVDRWRSSEQKQRWLAAALLDIEPRLHRIVPELITAIKQYLDNHNQNPRVFVWTASVERILTKVAKCKEVLDAVH